jgi:hypothetical protein
MLSNFEIVGYCCLIFAIVTYITNFKETNKGFIYIWRSLLKEGREQYYLENYPNGYYLLKPYRGNTDFYYQTISEQQYHRDMLYNRKMMEK